MANAAPVEIRAATEADLPALEWGGEFTRYRRVYRHIMAEARQGRRLLLLGEIEGSVIGQIFIQFSAGQLSSRKGIRTAYFHAFRVMPRLRNQGIGTQLLRAAESIVCQRGFQRTVISVAMDNVAAKRLYERLGYRVFAEDAGEWSYVDHEGRLQRVKLPSFLMEKRLRTPGSETC